MKRFGVEAALPAAKQPRRLKPPLLGTRKLGRTFYRRPAEELARELIGKVIVRRFEDVEYRARIVETEAYVGGHDLASHASKGRTARTEIMFGPPGFVYVYLIYGMYDMFNIVASTKGDAQAVLVRAAEPLEGFEENSKRLLSGPGKLCRGLHITRRRDNGLDLTGDRLFLIDDDAAKPRIMRSARIGVEYSQQWQHKLLRFFDADSASISGTREQNAVGKPTRKTVWNRNARPTESRGTHHASRIIL